MKSLSGTLKFPPLMRRGILALFLIAPWAMRDTLARFVNQRSIISEIFLMCVDILMHSPQKSVHALVTSRLDNCNAVLFGLPDYLIKRLQYVLNAAARLVSLINKYDHITPVMMQLHWLPVKERINFKILLTTFKALHGINPLYLCELISPYQLRRALRSSDQLLLEQPAYKLKSYDSRAFSMCAPGLWNKLPLEIKSSTSVLAY